MRPPSSVGVQTTEREAPSKQTYKAPLTSSPVPGMKEMRDSPSVFPACEGHTVPYQRGSGALGIPEVLVLPKEPQWPVCHCCMAWEGWVWGQSGDGAEIAFSSETVEVLRFWGVAGWIWMPRRTICPSIPHSSLGFRV